MFYGTFAKKGDGHFPSTVSRPFPGGGNPARLKNARRIAARGRVVLPPILFIWGVLRFRENDESKTVQIQRKSEARNPMRKSFAIWVFLGIDTDDPRKAASGHILLGCKIKFADFCAN